MGDREYGNRGDRGGRGGRGRGRGRGRGGYRNERSEPSKVDTTIDKDKEKILRRRRERFEKDANKDKEEVNVNKYGLISRGEDMTLKNDKNARVLLYADTMKRVGEYVKKDEKSDVERDSILMSFRKLRESVVAVSEENRQKKTDVNDEQLKLFRNIYIESIRFGVGYGQFESYVPAIQWVLPVVFGGEWNFTESETEWIVVQAAHQLAVGEHRYEESLQLLNRHLQYRPVDLNKKGRNSVESLYLDILELLNAEGRTRAQQQFLSYRGAEKTAQLNKM